METTGQTNKLLTVKEASAWLRVSPYTLREWIRLRKIRAVKSGERIIRVEMEALEQWVRLHRIIKRGV